MDRAGSLQQILPADLSLPSGVPVSHQSKEHSWAPGPVASLTKEHHVYVAPDLCKPAHSLSPAQALLHGSRPQNSSFRASAVV